MKNNANLFVGYCFFACLFYLWSVNLVIIILFVITYLLIFPKVQPLFESFFSQPPKLKRALLYSIVGTVLLMSAFILSSYLSDLYHLKARELQPSNSNLERFEEQYLDLIQSSENFSNIKSAIQYLVFVMIGVILIFVKGFISLKRKGLSQR
ncbi:hypothetical protein [Paenibacillus sp. MMS18-CY102]|uniref:hypothetical protein n=1 Tax=Paenibacillus sp. MMS18-CY102 TaxID=2682849 RepID=UPI00136524D5|nr:hypothetical protein [Paenibacillus sp. MMS18-CY102]MWC30886.1 hypothetical protein [Paenibacillus sp. MMS18-CY102]